MLVFNNFKTKTFKYFLISIPFLHAFAINAWLPLPLLVSIICFFIIGFKNKFAIDFRQEDTLLLITFFMGVFMNIFHSDLIGSKNISHIIAWSITLFFSYFWTSSWVKMSKLSFYSLGKFSTYALITVSIGVLIDFLLANLYGLYLSDIVPYSFDKMEQTQSLNGLLLRPRGLSAEPGFTAVIFEMFLPLSYLYLKNFKQRKYFIYLFSLLCYLLLTSAASIISILISYILIQIIFNKKKYFFVKLFIFSIVILFFIQFYLNLSSDFDIFKYIIGEKIDRFFMGDDIRAEILNSLFSIWQSNPFGIGFGSVSQSFQLGNKAIGSVLLYGAGALNLYLEILLSSGFIGFLSFIFFIFFKIKNVLQSKNTTVKRVLLLALFSVSIHHFFISEIWFPMIWVLFALTNNIKTLSINDDFNTI